MDGLDADTIDARAHPQARVETHTLFVADWNGGSAAGVSVSAG